MDKKLLEPFLEILKIPSISTLAKHKSDMQKARKYLLYLFDSLGFKTETLKCKSHDAIFASLEVDSKLPTILIYGHYDVQPADPLDEWGTPPFEPTIIDNKVYARGATDNKGQFMAHIMALKKLMFQKIDLTANIKFIIEGEEEIGSISVTDLTKKYSKALFKCDFLVVSDTEMYKEGLPSIDTSLRGLLYTEITLQTAKQDLHSGQFGGIAENPINMLAYLITKIKDKNGKILIPGFYENVCSPSETELKNYEKLKTKEKDLINEGQMYCLGGGEKEYSLNERRWSRPTCDVNGIFGGYTQEGSKTIIPSKASAKISFRLVPNQDPKDIYQKFVKHVKNIVPKNIKLKVKEHASALPYKAPINHPVYEIMKKSLKKVWGKEPVYTGVGGSIGFVPVLAQTLNVPCLMVGFGLPDDNLHAPNERFNLTNYFNAIDTMVEFYKNLSQLKHN
ncbi:MAG: dipeptidase [Patescibacteria group bacterium]|nr:dipeptidase [Patescibacteria group bacterium]